MFVLVLVHTSPSVHVPLTLTHAWEQHHCRNCGKVVCGACSSQKVVIPGLDMQKAERVCSQCYDTISRERPAPGDARASPAAPAVVVPAPAAGTALASPDVQRGGARRGALRRVISTSFDDAPEAPPDSSSSSTASPC